jgi:acylphosphatase
MARPPRKTIVLTLILSALLAGMNADEKPTKACMVHYSGKVQGVGFRATTAEIARDFPITGWVKNLDDGRVQLLAEGPADAVDKFLKAIHTRWKDNIEKEEVKEVTVSGKFKSFDVVK